MKNYIFTSMIDVESWNNAQNSLKLIYYDYQTNSMKKYILNLFQMQKY